MDTLCWLRVGPLPSWFCKSVLFFQARQGGQEERTPELREGAWTGRGTLGPGSCRLSLGGERGSGWRRVPGSPASPPRADSWVCARPQSPGAACCSDVPMPSGRHGARVTTQFQGGHSGRGNSECSEVESVGEMTSWFVSSGEPHKGVGTDVGTDTGHLLLRAPRSGCPHLLLSAGRDSRPPLACSDGTRVTSACDKPFQSQRCEGRARPQPVVPRPRFRRGPPWSSQSEPGTATATGNVFCRFPPSFVPLEA